MRLRTQGQTSVMLITRPEDESALGYASTCFCKERISNKGVRSAEGNILDNLVVVHSPHRPFFGPLPVRGGRAETKAENMVGKQ